MVILHSFTSNLYKPLHVKCMSCRQHIVGSFFFDPLWKSQLLVKFRQLMFKVIIDTVRSIATIFVTVFCSLSLFFALIFVFTLFSSFVITNPPVGELVVAESQDVFPFHAVPGFKRGNLLCCSWSGLFLPEGYVISTGGPGSFLIDSQPCLPFPALLKLLSLANVLKLQAAFSVP